MEQRTRGRLFEVVTPSPEDVTRARELPRTACPRRYCWWWQSLAFDWDIPIAEGCKFFESPKPPGFRYADMACRRCDSASVIDHYEPREPHLEADGFHRYEFCGEQNRIPGGALIYIRCPRSEEGPPCDDSEKEGETCDDLEQNVKELLGGAGRITGNGWGVNGFNINLALTEGEDWEAWVARLRDFLRQLGVRRTTFFDAFPPKWKPGMEWQRVEIFGPEKPPC